MDRYIYIFSRPVRTWYTSLRRCTLNSTQLNSTQLNREDFERPKLRFFVVWGVAFLLISATSTAQELRNDLGDPKRLHVKLENPSFSIIRSVVDVGDLELGKVATIPLRFENLLDSEIRFKDVVVQCACTGARIPDEVVKVSSSLDGEIDLAISRDERSLSKVFSIEIKTEGSIDSILLDLKARISGVVGFNQDIYAIAYDSEKLSSNKAITFKLPVIASPDMDLAEIVVSISGVLQEKAGDHIKAEFRPVIGELPVKNSVGFVTIQIAPDALTSTEEFLTVSIRGKNFDVKSTQVVLKKKLPVSLIPEALFFSSSDLQNIQAFGIIRVGPDLDASTMKLVSVKLLSGETLDATLAATSNKIAKISLTCSKASASLWKGSSKELEIAVECNGQQYLIKARCHFQW